MIIIGKYRVRRMNTLNLLLEERTELTNGKNKGQEVYKELGFHNDYEGATSAIVHLMIAEHTPDEDDAKMNTARAVNRKLNAVHTAVMAKIKETIEYISEEKADVRADD